MKAETQLTAGQFNEGLESAELALAHASKTDDRYFVPRIHAVAARLEIELNQPEKSAHHARLATETANEFGMSAKVTKLLI